MIQIWSLILVGLPLASSFIIHPPTGSRASYSAPKAEVCLQTTPSRTALFSFYDKQRREKQEAAFAAQEAWARRFEEVLIIQGQDLCVEAYEGFLRTGSKGAVLVKADEPPGPTGYPVEFRALESFLSEPASKLSPEEKDNLVEMVTSYDPEAEFPVLFEFQGQRGVNVMRPQYPPRYIFERVRGKR